MMVQVDEHAAELKTDDLISHHLDILYDQMLEGNLLKIIHPFSCVEISHVAKLINMSEAAVCLDIVQKIFHSFIWCRSRRNSHK